MVIPFFGYGTMERAIRTGEIVTAKTRARLLSSIPMASRGTQVFLLDLHVSAVAHYFEGAQQVDLAKRMDMSVRAIEGRLYRARQLLREALSEIE